MRGAAGGTGHTGNCSGNCPNQDHSVVAPPWLSIGLVMSGSGSWYAFIVRHSLLPACLLLLLHRARLPLRFPPFSSSPPGRAFSCGSHRRLHFVCHHRLVTNRTDAFLGVSCPSTQAIPSSRTISWNL